MLESWHVLRLSMVIAMALAALGVAGTTSADVARHSCVPKSAEIRFRAADGTRLAGYRLGKGRTAVVLVSGVNIRPALSGVISLSGPAVFTGLDALKIAPRLTVPTLYVVGQLDSDFVPDAQRLHDATASNDKAVHVLPVAHHGVDLVRFDAQARALVESFIRSR